MSNVRNVLIIVFAIMASAGSTNAATMLTDGNSSVTIDDRNGMTVWRINDTEDNVFLSNYYVRLGETGNEFALSELLGAPTVATSGTNNVTLTFQNDTLRAVVSYSLTGGSMGDFDSLVDTAIELTNLGTDPLDLHLFQYSDFDLKFDQANQLDQIQYLSRSSLIQYRTGTDLGLFASVDTEPTHYQSTSSFLDFYFKFFLDQDGPTTLDDTPGIGIRFPDPASDSAFAFQWDRALASGETFGVGSSFRMATIPEPSSLALFGIGAAWAVFVVRRRR